MSLNMKRFYLTLQNYINQSMALKLLFLVQDLALFIKKVPIDSKQQIGMVKNNNNTKSLD